MCHPRQCGCLRQRAFNPSGELPQGRDGRIARAPRHGQKHRAVDPAPIGSRTLGESYAVIFDQYAEQVGHECYAGLVRAQLPARLDAARERIRQILGDSDLLHKMQAEVMRRENSEAAPAMARVRNHLKTLRTSSISFSHWRMRLITEPRSLRGVRWRAHDICRKWLENAAARSKNSLRRSTDSFPVSGWLISMNCRVFRLFACLTQNCSPGEIRFMNHPGG